MEIVLDVIAFINAPGLQEHIFVASLRWLFLMVGSFFLILIVYVMRTSETWQLLNVVTADAPEFFSYRPRGMTRIGRRWRKIMARLETGNEAEYKLAIIEADTILGEILQKMNLPGETTEQRLAATTKIMIPTLDSAIEAHEIRNTIVYDPNYRISLADVRRIMDIFETVFRGLDLMG
jgi:hypothetical protein